MNRLQYIFENNITLKSDKWIHYFEIYEKHFGHLVGKDITLVEVGVSGGGSLQMWRKYFGPNAKIVGIDNDPNCLSHLAHYDSNTSVIIGDQGDTSFWDQVLPSIGPIDIFIDDGGHLYYQQITTFDKVFPVIKENGVFLCEDTHTPTFIKIFTKKTFCVTHIII